MPWTDLAVAAVAFAAGNLVGWFARAAWQTRSRPEGVDARTRDLVILVMLIVVTASAWLSIRASNRVADEQERRAETIECLSTWSVDFAEALDARTSRSTEITKARDRMDAAAAAVFSAVLPLFRPEAGPEDSDRLRAALERHRSAYATLDDLIRKQGATQAANPYPEPPRACYDN